MKLHPLQRKQDQDINRAASDFSYCEVLTTLQDDFRLRDQMLDASVDCIKVIAVDGTLVHMNRSGCLALGIPDTRPNLG